jgi:hypothetical protein
LDEQPYSPQHEAAVFSHWYGRPDLPPAGDVPLTLTAEEMKRVYDLVDRIKAGNPLRQIAEDFLTRNGTGRNALAPALSTLTRPNRARWQERQVAVWVMGSADLAGSQRDFATDTLVQVLEGRLEPDASHRARRAAWYALIAGFFLALPIHDADNPYLPIACSIFLLTFCTVFAAQRSVDRTGGISVAAEAVTALGKLRAVKSLDVVVAATQRTRGARGRKRARLRSAAMAALPSILTAVTEQHEGQFRGDTIQGLCRLLKTGDEPLVLAILQAFPHIGNANALNEVQRLAAGEGRAAHEPRTHSAAQRCLPLLQARIARERDPHVLLRGASVPPVPNDQLLRSNPDPAPFDPMEMLRASADPNWKGNEQEVGLVLQILQHLSEQGDMRAVPFVEQIAGSVNADARVRAAANACLPILRAHLELEQYSPKSPESLNLRASG